MYTFENILERIKKQDFTEEEISLVRDAYKFALRAHDGQKRKNGEDEIVHLLTVTSIVCDLNVDAITLASSLLHETVVLSGVTYEILENRFGPEVKIIIENLAKLRKVKLTEYNESSSIYLRKILVGLSQDFRVLIIKLADEGYII